VAMIVATGNGNWSSVTPNAPWPDGVVPGDGDTADLGGFTVVMDIARVPGAGDLLALISPATAGQLTVDLSVLGDCSINAVDIIAGTNNTGIVNVTGAAPAATLTVNGNVFAGGGSDDYGVYHYSTGKLIVNGDVTAGTANYARGVLGASSADGLITINGSVTAGAAGAFSYGVVVNGVAGVIINNGNLIHTDNTVAVVGRNIVYNPGPTNYIQWGTTKFRAGSVSKLAGDGGGLVA